LVAHLAVQKAGKWAALWAERTAAPRAASRVDWWEHLMVGSRAASKVGMSAQTKAGYWAALTAASWAATTVG